MKTILLNLLFIVLIILNINSLAENKKVKSQLYSNELGDIIINDNKFKLKTFYGAQICSFN